MTSETRTETDAARRVLRRETRSLTCKLSDEEIQFRGRQAGVKSGELRDENASFEAEKESHKGRVKALESDLAVLHVALETGTESRPIECEHVINEELTRVDVVRVDTGETVDYRPLTPEERQRELFRRNGDEEKPAAETYKLKRGKGKKGAAEPEAAAETAGGATA